jgi:hypothetical protein
MSLGLTAGIVPGSWISRDGKRVELTGALVTVEGFAEVLSLFGAGSLKYTHFYCCVLLIPFLPAPLFSFQAKFPFIQPSFYSLVRQRIRLLGNPTQSAAFSVLIRLK